MELNIRLNQFSAMLFHKSLNLPQFGCSVTVICPKRDGTQPELGFVVIATNMDVGRFVAFPTVLQNLLVEFQIHPIADEMRRLAEAYLQAEAFTRVMLDDALHVAAATSTRQDILISWNFNASPRRVVRQCSNV